MKLFTAFLVSSVALTSVVVQGQYRHNLRRARQFDSSPVQDDDGNLQNLNELEGTPFVLGDGTEYRDLLTIGASRAVAQYAARFQPEERQRVRRTITLLLLLYLPN